MQTISNAIKEGAEAFLARQNKTIGILAVVVAALLFALYAFLRPVNPQYDPLPRFALAGWTIGSFVFGAACSVVAGYIGMWISIRTNIRTASAAVRSLNDALQTALRGGAVAGLFVVAMCLLGISILFLLVQNFSAVQPKDVPLVIAGFGFGASFVALFAQLGGGIYTKAADVGADLVGKVEAGIPEDDPRNPAVIADLVGDNVGDCAGRGADLFESTAAENIGALILGASLFAANAKLSFAGSAARRDFVSAGCFCVCIIASIIGVMFVKTKEDTDNPMKALNFGYYVTAVIAAALFAGACYWLLNPGMVNFRELRRHRVPGFISGLAASSVF